MNAREELVRRCAERRREKIGGLSDQAFSELLLAVRENPRTFIDTPAEQAFLDLAEALEAYEGSFEGDDLLDDDEYLRRRTQRLSRLSAACGRISLADPGCTDARLVSIAAAEPAPDELMGSLLDLRRELGRELPHEGAGGDAWEGVFARPALRLDAAILRAAADSARFRMALDVGGRLMSLAPSDVLGARLTCALAYARLEDEEGFDRLDARFGRRGNAWSNLARVVLLYKLSRMPAARRALRSFGELSRGGAYALLKPTFVEPYLPDRPAFAPGSFEEAVACVHESEPILADVPDFIAWAQDQPWFAEAAASYAERNDLDW